MSSTRSQRTSAGRERPAPRRQATDKRSPDSPGARRRSRSGGRGAAAETSRRSGGDPLTPALFVVSDGRGETCAQVVRAALVQFEGQPCVIRRHANVRTARRVEALMKAAQAARAVVFYTLVGDDTRDAMGRAARRLLVPAVDVLGPAFSALHDLFKCAPRATPGLLYASNREHFDRQLAIEYTLKHDDGQHPDGLGDADVVLVGVSRVSKSSTCFYLAYEGIKAANVPLVPGVPPPPQLRQLAPERVIGLRTNVHRLMTVREARAGDLGIEPTNDYFCERAIAREMIDANRLMDAHDWRSIDVSYMAIEEIAREVLALTGLRTRR